MVRINFFVGSMKGDLVVKILEMVLNGMIETSDMWGAFLDSGYGASYSKMSRNLEIRRNKREATRAIELERHKFYSTLSRMKKDGLVVKDKRGWVATVLGKKKLGTLRSIKSRSLPSRKYQGEKSRSIVIVAFDVPEKERRKRAWLRGVLLQLGFTMFQKSVWIGKVKLPEDFLLDLRRLGLVSRVGILSVRSRGTIRSIV